MEREIKTEPRNFYLLGDEPEAIPLTNFTFMMAPEISRSINLEKEICNSLSLAELITLIETDGNVRKHREVDPPFTRFLHLQLNIYSKIPSKIKITVSSGNFTRFFDVEEFLNSHWTIAGDQIHLFDSATKLSDLRVGIGLMAKAVPDAGNDAAKLLKGIVEQTRFPSQIYIP